MLAEPIASVVLPYRNSEKTLERCLNSILKQNFTCWELLAINDHSTDSSEEIVLRKMKSDHRIYNLKNKETGIVSALNLGLEKARGEIIIRMDSDDSMNLKRVGEQVRFLEANPKTGLVASKVSYISDSAESFDGRGYAFYVKWLNQVMANNEIENHRFEESPLAHPSVAFRKSIVLTNGGYREGDFPEDYELWLRWLSMGITMAKIDSVLLYWYDSPSRLSRQDKRYSQEAFQKIKAGHFSFWIRQKSLGNRKLSALGTGKVAKKQILWLNNHGVKIEKYYEVNPKKIGSTHQDSPICHFNEINSSGAEFIIILYCPRSAKYEIRKFLENKDLKIAKDFLFLG